MPYINIDLYDVDVDDMLYELRNRVLDNDQKKVFDYLYGCHQWQKFGDGKWELFAKVEHRYSVSELEELFGEKNNPVTVPKEQLSLPL